MLQRWLAIVQRLAPQPGEDVKQLAKRLKFELADAGVSIKHVIALEAAARLLGNENWFSSNEQPVPPTLSLQSLVNAGDMTGKSWRDLSDALVKHGTYALSVTPATALQVEPGERMLTLNAVTHDGQGRTQLSPLCVVLPSEHEGTWLNGAAATFESLRRRFEETGQANVEGLAVLALCSDTVRDGAFPPSASALTELVLLRVDGDAQGGYPNVPLLNFVDIDRMTERMSERLKNYVRASQVDVLLCTDDEDPVGAIELDSALHDSPEAQERDELKKKVFSMAGLPLVRIRAATLTTYVRTNFMTSSRRTRRQFRRFAHGACDLGATMTFWCQRNRHTRSRRNDTRTGLPSTAYLSTGSQCENWLSSGVALLACQRTGDTDTDTWLMLPTPGS